MIFQVHSAKEKLCNEWEARAHLDVQGGLAGREEHVFDFVVGVVEHKNKRGGHQQDNQQGTHENPKDEQR